jgi:hypothetical protein
MLIYLVEGLVVVLHYLGVGHAYMAWTKYTKTTRKLTGHEMGLARTVFGQSIDYHKVIIDEKAILGPKQYQFAYVSLNMINIYGEIQPVHLVHELMHVWQYQHLGIRYIPRALHAQHFGDGYHYGGIEAIHHALGRGKTILDFNYEQQAEIAADYFCIQHGYQPKYVAFDQALLPHFEQLTKVIRHKKDINTH